MTRVPRVRDWAVFSASWPHETTSKNDVASSHSWVWRFCQRRLTATPKVAVAWPLGVNRSSGSRVRLPTMLMWFPLDMVLRSVCLCLRHFSAADRDRARWASGSLVWQPDDLVTDYLVCEVQHPVEVGHGGRLSRGVDEDVIALRLVLELVREPAFAPSLNPRR